MKSLYEAHRTSIVLVLVYGVSRSLASAFTQMTLAGYGPAFGLFLEQGRFSAAGAYPFVDYWMEYPPMYPWLTVLAYAIASRIPAWDNSPIFWFGAALRWVVVPFEVGALLLVYKIGHTLDSESSARYSALLYAVTFAVGYVPLGWFDLLPTFWLLLAAYFALRDKPLLSGAAVGMGFLSKPIPLFVLPMAWQRFAGRRDRAKVAVAALLSCLLPLTPFLLIDPTWLRAYGQTLASRSSWETIWAFLDGYYRYGAVALMNQRFDPASAAFEAHPASGLYSPWNTIAFALLGLFLWTRRIDWKDNRRALAFVGFTWSLFTLWTRGYSPQWTITFVPFVALLLPHVRGALYLALLSVAIVAEWPAAFTLAADQQWYLIAVVIWRTALFLLIAIEMGGIVFGRTADHRLQIANGGLASNRPRLSLSAAMALGLGLLIAAGTIIGVRAAQGYVASRLSLEPLRSAIRVIREQAMPEAGVICRDIAVCERLRPYLSGVSIFWLPDPSGWQSQRLPEFAEQHRDLWLVEEFHEDAGHDLSVEGWLSERYGKASQEWRDGARVSRFVGLTFGEEQAGHVTFDGKIRLTAYALAARERFLAVALTWQTAEPLPASYKVFVHVRDSSGNLVGQNDQYPVGNFRPTDQWAPGETIRDLHGVLLPHDFRPEWTVLIGLYDAGTGERLKLTAPGEPAGSDAFEIAPNR